MTAAGRIVVVGASLAGVRVAEYLRREGHRGPITLVGDEVCLPYDRPPLSKSALIGAGSPSPTILLTEAKVAELEVDLVLGTAAVGLDDRSVRLVDGRAIDFDELVICTGARAHQPFPQPPAGVHTLRTLEDAVNLHRALREATKVVVVGAGFIGLEVASTARVLGLAVTMIEAAPKPLTRNLGEHAASIVIDLAVANGVDLHCGTSVSDFETVDGRVAGVRLSNGEVVSGDLVVVGVGSRPNSDWIVDPNIPLQAGAVLCEDTGRVRGRSNVWAVGDVAAWAQTSGQHVEQRRHEHWTSAVDQAQIVAKNIVGTAVVKLDKPDYVWSDQFGVKVNILGDCSRHDEVRILELDPPAVFYGRQGRLVGACVIDHQRLVLKARQWLARDVALRSPEIDALFETESVLAPRSPGLTVRTGDATTAQPTIDEEQTA